MIRPQLDTSNEKDLFDGKMSTFLKLGKHLSGNIDFGANYNSDNSYKRFISHDIAQAITDSNDELELRKKISLSNLSDVSNIGIYCDYITIGGRDCLISMIEDGDKFISFCEKLINYYQYQHNLIGDTGICDKINQSMNNLLYSLKISLVYGIDEVLGFTPLQQTKYGFTSSLSETEYFERFIELRELSKEWEDIINYISNIQDYSGYLKSVAETKKWFQYKIINEMAVLLSLYYSIRMSNGDDILTTNTNFSFQKLCTPTQPNSEYNIKQLIHRTRRLKHNLERGNYTQESKQYLKFVCYLMIEEIEKYTTKPHKWDSPNKEFLIQSLEALHRELKDVTQAFSSTI